MTEIRSADAPLPADIKSNLLAVTRDLCQRTSKLFADGGLDPPLTGRLVRNVEQTLQDAYFVYCVGAPRSIPIDDIYQPSNFHDAAGVSISLDTMLQPTTDRVIFAGPGVGKTTFLNYSLVETSRRRQVLPLYFGFRGTGSLRLLSDLVSALAQRKEAQMVPTAALFLLLDGFDELRSADRFELATVLRQFQSLSYGAYYLTCRTYYEVSGLNCLQVFLGPFRRQDSIYFVREYFRAVSCERDAAEFVSELEGRRLQGIAETPLLLSLACLVRSVTGPAADGLWRGDIPTSSVELLDRALSLLISRWDDDRNVKREYRVKLDGFSRLQCLKRLAIGMPALKAQKSFVDREVRRFLKLKQLDDLDVDDLLTEIAQGFGIFVRTKDNSYQFIHSAFHDFLAAKASVETGQFFPAKVEHWDMRAGYAASLTQDATQSLIYALRHGLDNVAFFECLSNQAPFDTDRVAAAVFENLPSAKQKLIISHLQFPDRVEVKMPKEFFSIASLAFLRSLLSVGAFERQRSWILDVIVGYTAAELSHRGVGVSDTGGELRKEYKRLYDTMEFRFRVYLRRRTVDCRLGDAFDLG